MTLADLIAALENEDPNKVLPHGFANPHSYRGDYMDLAFAPASNVTVGSMLDAARSALGATFQGYKGGDYVMGEHTDCWLAEYGRCGETIGPLLLKLMLAAAIASAPREDLAKRIATDLTKRNFLGWLLANGSSPLWETRTPEEEIARVVMLSAGPTIDQLQAELARLRAGEAENPAPPHATHTAAQLLRRLNDAATDERLQLIERMLDANGRASQCFQMDHEERLRSAEHDRIALAGVQALHHPITVGGIRACAECSSIDRAPCRIIPWQCPTIRALDAPEARRATVETTTTHSNGDSTAMTTPDRVNVRVLITVGDQAELETPDHEVNAPLRMPAATIAQDAGLPANELPGRRFTAVRDGEQLRDFRLVDDPRL